MECYELKSNRLSVKVALGGDEYKGTRFDWAGMISEVILDNKDKFCSKESLVKGEGSGGIGLYNEFGIEEPIGYDEAKIGGLFPKIGVGLLTKESNEKYDFFHTYPVKAFKRNVEINENTIIINVEPSETRGYSVEYSKKISLENNEIIIEYQLENTGTNLIETTEYCHNFVAINEHLIGSNYSLKFSYPVELESKLGEFEVYDNEITWTKELSDVMYCRLKNFSKEKNQYFELLHKPSGVGFRETSSFNIERVAVWGMPHVISPEAFIKIKIYPGQKQRWKRIYTFFN